MHRHSRQATSQWRPCNAGDRRNAPATHRAAPVKHRSRRPAATGPPEGSISGTTHPRVARWGVLGRVVSRGPDITKHSAAPGATQAGPRMTAWRGPRSRQDPRPQTSAPKDRTQDTGPKKAKGAGTGPTPFGTAMTGTCGPRATLRGRWDQSGVARGGGPVWIRWTDPANVRPSGRPPPGSRKN